MAEIYHIWTWIALSPHKNLQDEIYYRSHVKIFLLSLASGDM